MGSGIRFFSKNRNMAGPELKFSEDVRKAVKEDNTTFKTLKGMVTKGKTFSGAVKAGSKKFGTFMQNRSAAILRKVQKTVSSPDPQKQTNNPMSSKMDKISNDPEDKKI